MRLLKSFNKASLLTEKDECEEYEVEIFTPLKVKMTSELLYRKREEEIREKYCRHTK